MNLTEILLADIADTRAAILDNEKLLNLADLKQLLALEQASESCRPEIVHTIERCITRKGFAKARDARA